MCIRDSEDVVPGRVLKTIIQWDSDVVNSSSGLDGWAAADDPGCMIIIYNCHVWGFSLAQHRQITQSIMSDFRSVQDSPLQKVLMVEGDFNSLAPGEMAHLLDPWNHAHAYG
eukprot:11964210-Karenia_brevis.AAC.1